MPFATYMVGGVDAVPAVGSSVKVEQMFHSLHQRQGLKCEFNTVFGEIITIT